MKKLMIAVALVVGVLSATFVVNTSSNVEAKACDSIPC